MILVFNGVDINTRTNVPNGKSDSGEAFSKIPSGLNALSHEWPRVPIGIFRVTPKSYLGLNYKQISSIHDIELQVWLLPRNPESSI